MNSLPLSRAKSVIMLFFASATAKKKYGIMIDAGSGGTRAHLYNWDDGVQPPNVEPVKENGKPCYVEYDNPLASAAKDINKIKEIFEPIIKFATSKIPSSEYVKTKIYVYATAGMRLLPALDQDRIIQETYKYLSSSPFKVKPNYVRIIDGLEEGVFGWISVNHLLGNLQEGKETVGAIDMGGASFQIALEVAPDETALHTVKVGSRTIQLYAHSYLGYGAMESLGSVTRALHAVSNNNTIYHPCFPNGFEKDQDDLHIIGTGDFEACSHLADHILVQGSPFQSIKIPALKRLHEIVGMSSLYYTNKYLGLNDDSTLEDLKREVSDYCSTPYQQSVEKRGENKYSNTFCWTGVYQYTTFSRGYGFTDATTKISKANDINGVPLSWTIGAMVYHVSEIEIDEKVDFPYAAVTIVNLCAFALVLYLYITNERRQRPVWIQGMH